MKKKMSRQSIYLNPKFNSTVHINPNFLKTTTQPETVHVNPLFLLRENSVLPDNEVESTRAVVDPHPIIKKSRHKLLRRSNGTISNSNETTTSQSQLTKSTTIEKSRMIKIGRNKLLKASIFIDKTKATTIKSTVEIRKPSSYKLDNRINCKPKAVKLNMESKNKKLILKKINGVVYKSSKNRLFRQNSGTCSTVLSNIQEQINSDRLVSVHGKKFILKEGGKKLVRIGKISEDTPGPSREIVEIGGLKFSQLDNSSTYIRFEQGISTARKHLTISRHRSMNIILNKMRKSNVPCPVYRRLGKCLAFTRGRCPKVHDKNMITVCPRALKKTGCTKEGCLLSHDLSLSKMPTCKYFLKGCCTNDGCPYLHNKLNKNAEICVKFLQGFCAKADQCDQRHEFLCPEYEKSNVCSRKQCLYPHSKSKLNTEKFSKEPLKSKAVHKITESKYNTNKTTSNNSTSLSKRYFMESDSNDHMTKQISQEGQEKLTKIFKKVHQMKNQLMMIETNSGKINIIPNDDRISDTLEADNIVSDTNTISSKERPPVGILPDFIQL